LKAKNGLKYREEREKEEEEEFGARAVKKRDW
jgi:hypothetical protein